MDATSIFLDGNNFRSFLSPSFIGRSKVNSLFLNNSKIVIIGPKSFAGLSQLEILHLEDNWLEEIGESDFSNLTSLRELYLHDNRIFHIDQGALVNLSNLQVLSLHNNRISVFPVWKLSTLPQLSYISLTNNSWICDCSFVEHLQQFVRQLTTLDTSLLECLGPEGRVDIGFGSNTSCANSFVVPVSHRIGVEHQQSVVALISALSVCLVLGTSLCLVMIFRGPLQVWLHSQYGVRLSKDKDNSEERVYDACISYSARDEEFLQQAFVPQLDPCYRLCLQHRDFPQGSSLVDSWPAVEALCSRLILLVSRAFLSTEWELIQHRLGSITKTCKPIIILLGDLTPTDLSAVPEMGTLLKTSVVIKWGDSGFWNKLRFHLPNARKRVETLQKSLMRPGQALRGMDWHYDSTGQIYSDISSSTHSTSYGGMINPLDQPQDSVYSEPLYQRVDEQAREGDMIEVVLLTGEVVPATLVRHHTGRIMPLVMQNQGE